MQIFQMELEEDRVPKQSAISMLTLHGYIDIHPVQIEICVLVTAWPLTGEKVLKFSVKKHRYRDEISKHNQTRSKWDCTVTFPYILSTSQSATRCRNDV